MTSTSGYSGYINMGHTSLNSPERPLQFAGMQFSLGHLLRGKKQIIIEMIWGDIFPFEHVQLDAQKFDFILKILFVDAENFVQSSFKSSCFYVATSTIVMDQSDPTIPRRVFIKMQHPFNTLSYNNQSGKGG